MPVESLAQAIAIMRANLAALPPIKPKSQEEIAAEDEESKAENVRGFQKLFGLPDDGTADGINHTLEAIDEHWRAVYHGIPPDSVQSQPKPKPEKKRSWWPGKPKTDEEWLAYAAKKNEVPGATLVFDKIGDGKKRGYDIMNRIQGNGARWKYDCGCILDRDSRGTEYLSPCRDHMDE